MGPLHVKTVYAPDYGLICTPRRFITCFSMGWFSIDGSAGAILLIFIRSRVFTTIFTRFDVPFRFSDNTSY